MYAHTHTRKRFHPLFYIIVIFYRTPIPYSSSSSFSPPRALYLIRFIIIITMHSKENNGLHQAFQYLSTLSAHSIFSRKSNSLLHEPETHSILTQESVEDFSPFTSRSNSNITISSIDSPTPSIHCLEEPWRLLEDGNLQHDYFFSDRQDLYNGNNDQIERFVTKQMKPFSCI